VHGATGPAASGVSETASLAFVSVLIDRAKRLFVLVNFWAGSCGPFKRLTPSLEKPGRATERKSKLVKMNIDELPAMQARWGIERSRTLIAVLNGRLIHRALGALIMKG